MHIQNRIHLKLQIVLILHSPNFRSSHIATNQCEGKPNFSFRKFRIYCILKRISQLIELNNIIFMNLSKSFYFLLPRLDSLDVDDVLGM